MLLYCRTDCCENLDFFLSLSKSTCNSIWSGINTVAQILCREWCIHLYLKKKKLGDYFGGRGAHDTAHCLQHIRCIKSCEYTWPIQLSFLCPKYNSWTEVVHSGVGVVLSLVCWHIQSCFFSAAFVSQWTVIAESWISTSSSSEFSSVYNIEYTSCWLWLSKYYLMA